MWPRPDRNSMFYIIYDSSSTINSLIHTTSHKSSFHHTLRVVFSLHDPPSSANETMTICECMAAGKNCNNYWVWGSRDTDIRRKSEDIMTFWSVRRSQSAERCRLVGTPENSPSAFLASFPTVMAKCQKSFDRAWLMYGSLTQLLLCRLGYGGVAKAYRQ